MRALESKVLRADRDNKNRWKISPEALEEWAKNRPDTDRTVAEKRPDTETGQLREELATAKATISGLEARLSDTQADRDAWRRQAERLASEGRPTGLFGRLFGR